MERFKELSKKYGKVALGVHVTVSAATITGLYLAVKNNVDVESMLEKVGMPSLIKNGGESGEAGQREIPKMPPSPQPNSDGFVVGERQDQAQVTADIKQRNKTADLVVSSGGALALAVLLNKALFPVRVPITFALTPPVARFLARRKIIKNSL